MVLKHEGEILNKNNVVVPTGFEPSFNTGLISQEGVSSLCFGGQ